MKASWLHPCFVLLLAAGVAGGQNTTVTARVVVGDGGKKSKSENASDVVVWLVPSDETVPAPLDSNAPKPRLVQRNKNFEPHVLVVRVGSQVEFPNRDPFFHNVFSLFEGKRFDLGLYEAGTSRNVLFDKPGISYIFCNIHAEMSAVVIALNTPYYAVSDRRGQVLLAGVPPGRYTLRVWHDGVAQEALNALSREITISENTSTLGMVRVPAGTPQPPHKNLYGRDYQPPEPAGTPTYVRP